MLREERTAVFVRLLIAGTVDKPIIDDSTLMRIENSEVPFNPIDYTLITHSLVDQGVDWRSRQGHRTICRIRGVLVG